MRRNTTPTAHDWIRSSACPPVVSGAASPPRYVRFAPIASINRCAMRYSGLVESRMGAVAWAIRQRPVSHPRSSNRACRFPAPGFPTSFIEGHTGSDPTARGICPANDSPSPFDTATSDGSGLQRCCQAYRQSPRPRHLRKRTGSQGPLLRRHYPVSTLVRPCPTPDMAAALKRR